MVQYMWIELELTNVSLDIFNIGKAVKVMLESCVKLGGTLLEQWTPEGDERDDRKSDRDFKNDVEDFFETAKCTKFDDDIQVS